MTKSLKDMTTSLKPRKRLSRPAPRRSSAATARELLLRVRDIGGDLEALLHRAGLPQGVDRLLNPRWRGPLSGEEFARLYAQCTWALDAHASQQEGRAPLTKPELDMLCYCVITCATLGEAIARTVAFCGMLAPRTAALTICVDDREMEVGMPTIRSVRNVSGFVSDLTGLATFHRLFGWLIGEVISPMQAAVSYPRLLSDEATARLLPVPIGYGASVNSLRFPVHYLERPVVRTYAELLVLLERFPFDPDELQSKAAPLSETVRLILTGALAEGSALPTASVLAHRFSMGTATLRRQLAEEGLSLRHIKEMIRREVAERLLADKSLAIADIAARTGFSDLTAFSRAFTGWTGNSPGRWRAGREI